MPPTALMVSSGALGFVTLVKLGMRMRSGVGDGIPCVQLIVAGAFTGTGGWYGSGGGRRKLLIEPWTDNHRASEWLDLPKTRERLVGPINLGLCAQPLEDRQSFRQLLSCLLRFISLRRQESSAIQDAALPVRHSYGPRLRQSFVKLPVDLLPASLPRRHHPGELQPLWQEKPVQLGSV
jgi:hypothetical protein